MTILCFGAAASLFALFFSGGSIFGSANLARILAVVCIAVGISATMNIKGEEVQGEPILVLTQQQKPGEVIGGSDGSREIHETGIFLHSRDVVIARDLDPNAGRGEQHRQIVDSIL